MSHRDGRRWRARFAAGFVEDLPNVARDYRRMLRILLGGGTAIAGATSAMDTTATSRKPNILVISVDDLGFNLVGFRANAANNSDVVTPSIDQLAGEGIVMDRFYATLWCAPSRGALRTGRSMGSAYLNTPTTGKGYMRLSWAALSRGSQWEELRRGWTLCRGFSRQDAMETFNSSRCDLVLAELRLGNINEEAMVGCKNFKEVFDDVAVILR
ncbi:Arsi [Symbiodinium sp. KB8]|nr:Arsi [Symbiodinium sp. KB8]